MPNLCDEIERYIHRLLTQAREEGILLRRNDLAAKLRCAPSQISYVLTTRFTIERGFVVESRRGSGGYVRIFRTDFSQPAIKNLEAWIGKEIDVSALRRILEELRQEKQLTARETELIQLTLGGSYLRITDDTRATLLKILINTLGQSGLHL